MATSCFSVVLGDVSPYGGKAVGEGVRLEILKFAPFNRISQFQA